MLTDLILIFCKDAIVEFVVMHQNSQVVNEKILRPYFQHFLYGDYKIEEHRHPGISYRIFKGDKEIRINKFEHFLLKKYIKKYCYE